MAATIEIAAYHEAGHAVVARALGVGVGDLSVEPWRGAWAGSADIFWDEAGDDRVVIGVAGQAAEKILSSRRRYNWRERGDARSVSFGGGSDGDRVRDKDWRTAARRAEAILTKHWQAVEALAEALVASVDDDAYEDGGGDGAGFLFRDEVRELLDERFREEER